MTNGLWLRKTKNPTRLLKSLHNVGLRGLSLSIDRYHNPSLSTEEIANLLSIAKDVGLAINIRGAGKSARDRAIAFEKKHILDRQEGTKHFFSLENVGLAKKLPRDLITRQNRFSSCHAATQPFVMPDGKVMACCSAHVFQVKNDILAIGNLKEASLTEILDNSSRSYVLAALVVGGPIWLAKMIKKKVSTRQKTRCEVCLEILNNPHDVSELRRRIAESKELRKEIAGRMMVWEQCYRPELLPQFQSGV